MIDGQKRSFLKFQDVRAFLDSVLDEDIHTKRVDSLANATLGLKHPLIFFFGLLGECFDMRDSRAFTAFVPEKLLVFQSSKNIKSYNQVTCGMLTYWKDMNKNEGMLELATAPTATVVGGAGDRQSWDR